MVFKKPYAFLIKNFRIIHVILSAIIVFIISEYGSVRTFFSEYVRGNIRASYGLSKIYINSFLFLAVFLVIAFALAMYLLMRNKKKPTLFYVLTFTYYGIMLIALLIASGIMGSLEEATLTQQAARTYRDVYFMLSLPQYYFIFMSVVRAIGFDVKKFNFNKDLAELEIKSEDDEEFEFILGTDAYIYERKARRIIREIKYYILENKLIFTIVASAIGGAILIYIFMHVNFINKVYKLGQTGRIGNFSYRLNFAYATQYDYNGGFIKKDKYYIIVSMTVKNLSSREQSIDNTSLFLADGNAYFYNQPSLRNYFIDFGTAYTGEGFAPSSERNIIFIFESKGKPSANYRLKVLKEITVDEENQALYNYVDFKVKPKRINNKASKIERQVNEVMYLGEALYKDSNLIITKAELVSKYEFQYETCKEDQCKSFFDVVSPTDPVNQKLLVLSYKFKLNPGLGISESLKSDKYFFDRFLKLEYTYNGKTLIKNLTTKTNPGLKNKIFIDIPNSSISSDLFNIMINTRDYNYYIDYNKVKEK